METLYPCPVCLGIRMKKTIPVPPKALVVDRCPICGGVWFDKGEVKALRGVSVDAVRRYIDLSRKSHSMRCHYCYAPMDRNESKCVFCGTKNTIDCPICNQPMKRTRCRNLILDVCGYCGGVWFDRHELAAIWSPAFWKDGSVYRGAGNASDNQAWGLLDGLAYWPDGSGFGSGVVSGVSESAEGAVETVGHVAAEAGSTMLEGAGELLSGFAVEGIAEGAVEGIAGAAVEGVAEAAIEGVAEVAVEALAGVAESVAEAIFEAILEIIGGALG